MYRTAWKMSRLAVIQRRHKHHPASQDLTPYSYSSSLSKWIPLALGKHERRKANNAIQPGSSIKVVSWNINCFRAGPAARATACIDHIQELFESKARQKGEDKDRHSSNSYLVVMLQEVSHESLSAILNHRWAREMFVVSNITPLAVIQTEHERRKEENYKRLGQSPPFSTLILSSRSLPISSCFRLPLVSPHSRDVLAIDVPVNASPCSDAKSKDSKDREPPAQKNPENAQGVLRLCTTHLESNGKGRLYRPLQLLTLARVLKGELPAPTGDMPPIIGGLAGGDMNLITDFDNSLHRMPEINLQDVWELGSPEEKTTEKQTKETMTADTGESHGWAAGSTWGYHPDIGKNMSSSESRLDRFYLTAATPPLSLTVAHTPEAQDTCNGVGRLGIGVETRVQAWSRQVVTTKTAGSQTTQKQQTEYISPNLQQSYSAAGLDLGFACSDANAWVSDHFGIAVTLRLGTAQAD